MEIPRLITILGPTAVGKTRFAALLSESLGCEILSADSRQVYKGMTIGTGKDLDDYVVNGKQIPYHIIDVVHPDEEFHVFRFKQLFVKATQEILERKNTPLLCGGTGLYLDAVLRDYFFAEVPENTELRSELSVESTDSLAGKLLSMKKVHNKTDLEDRERLLRAIEIQHFHQNTDIHCRQIHIRNSHVFGIQLPREMVRQRITDRLKFRLENGLIDEVETLLHSGITTKRLIDLGLEYKFVTLYLMNEIGKEEMHEALRTAIHQFSKRQMSWFRRMERLGVNIHWIDGTLPEEQRIEMVITSLQK